MPVTIEYRPNSLCVLRVSGTLRRTEFGQGQEGMAHMIDEGRHPRVLAILENFDGWERTADWNDLDFQLSKGTSITKISIVGEPRGETEALAFGGAGLRKAPVRFFSTDHLGQARVWLAE